MEGSFETSINAIRPAGQRPLNEAISTLLAAWHAAKREAINLLDGPKAAGAPLTFNQKSFTSA